VDASPPVLESPAATPWAQPCIDVLHSIPQRPAIVQVSPWLGAGAGFKSAKATSSFSAGADATIAVAKLFQPPGGDNGGKILVRVGPWGALETPLDRLRGEGGLALALRQESFEAWGSLELRGGGGVDTSGRRHWIGSLSWGLYGEPLRTAAEWGGCDPKPPPRPPPTFALTNGIRLFASYRRVLDDAVNEWTFGVEFQPEWFLPLSDGVGYKRWLRH
jgi:hypothetical protein